MRLGRHSDVGNGNLRNVPIFRDLLRHLPPLRLEHINLIHDASARQREGRRRQAQATTADGEG